MGCGRTTAAHDVLIFGRFPFTLINTVAAVVGPVDTGRLRTAGIALAGAHFSPIAPTSVAAAVPVARIALAIVGVGATTGGTHPLETLLRILTRIRRIVKRVVAVSDGLPSGLVRGRLTSVVDICFPHDSEYPGIPGPLPTKPHSPSSGRCSRSAAVDPAAQVQAAQVQAARPGRPG
ncbi:hypothetical protein Acsp01_48010 [Actinoplanes sp. NBRC 101535]|nr:hypothetical protein Acsp01_48010 [Actinoplanes sp. NBRC 101535]